MCLSADTSGIGLPGDANTAPGEKAVAESRMSSAGCTVTSFALRGRFQCYYPEGRALDAFLCGFGMV
jgi:hypothetical protein